MKAVIIIAIWTTSLMFMATDNIIQAVIALCFFAFASFLLRKNKVEAQRQLVKLNKKIEKLLN